MPDLASLIPPEGNEPNRVLESGVVHAAPATSQSELLVVVNDKLVQVRKWLPQGENMPQPGDSVLIGIDEVDEPWAIMWWSSA